MLRLTGTAARRPKVAHLLVLALMLALVTPAGSPAAAVQPLPAMTERVLDQYVLPRFDKLKQATDKLAADVAKLCSGEKRRLNAVRADFEQAVLGWAEVEFLRFGPMSVTGRPERIVFWPDPRGVVQRQLAGVIARRDATALEPSSLAKKSAALQGLTALEVLLTDDKHPLGNDGDAEEARYRCRLAVAVAQNVASLVGEMAGDWNGGEGWRKRMLEPGPQNASYKTPAEPPAEFARALITGLQMLQDRQVVPLTAANVAPGKPARLAFAGSDLSARYVAAGVESLKDLYEAMGLGRDVPKAKAWMPQWITMAFKRLARDAPAAVKRNGAVAQGEERTRELRMLRFHVEGIRKLVGRELAPNAGLMIGFNELDGD